MYNAQFSLFVGRYVTLKWSIYAPSDTIGPLILIESGIGFDLRGPSLT